MGLHVTADQLGYAWIGTLLVSFVLFVITGGVMINLIALAGQKPSNRPWLPAPYQPFHGRADFILVVAWALSANHRRVGDPYLTGSVLIARAAILFFVANLLLVWIDPRFDVDIAAWLNGLAGR